MGLPDETAIIPEKDSGEVTSAELLARHLYGAKVVRTFSSVTSGDLLTDARPIGSPERRAIPLAGDDAAAKSVVSRFVSELGFDSLDVVDFPKDGSSKPTPGSLAHS